MKITWLGHSCFKIESKNYTIVLDPFEDGYVPGFANVRESANTVLCSHMHNDHCAAECVTLKNTDLPSPFTVETIKTLHDNAGGTLRGENTIHILCDGDVKIAHLGDLGCIPDEAILEKLEGLDAMLVPVGGFYTIDAFSANELINRLQPKVTIPMHYRSDTFGFDVLDTVERFAALCKNVVYSDSNSAEITKDTAAQVIVPKYIR